MPSKEKNESATSNYCQTKKEEREKDFKKKLVIQIEYTKVMLQNTDTDRGGRWSTTEHDGARRV